MYLVPCATIQNQRNKLANSVKLICGNDSVWDCISAWEFYTSVTSQFTSNYLLLNCNYI